MAEKPVEDSGEDPAHAHAGSLPGIISGNTDKSTGTLDSRVVLSSGHEPGTHGPHHCPTRKSGIFRFSIGLRPARSGLWTTCTGSKYPPFWGFYPSGGSKYPHFGGFSGPFGTPRGGCSNGDGKSGGSGPEGQKIGAIDQDFDPKKSDF